MGSSWRYRHVAITPYLLHRGISRPRLYFFMGFYFALMDEPANSFVGEKLRARIEVKIKKNWPNQPAPPFHSIFFNPGEPPLYQTRSHLLCLYSDCNLNSSREFMENCMKK